MGDRSKEVFQVACTDTEACSMSHPVLENSRVVRAEYVQVSSVDHVVGQDIYVAVRAIRADNTDIPRRESQQGIGAALNPAPKTLTITNKSYKLSWSTATAYPTARPMTGCFIHSRASLRRASTLGDDKDC